jgi:hypothetical protein
MILAFTSHSSLRPVRSALTRFGFALVRFGFALVRFGFALGALVVTVALVGCRTKSREDQSGTSKEQATSATGTGGSGPSAEAKKAAKSIEERMAAARAPVGPDLIVYPGKGVGAVRFGAYPSTIQRLLGAPCDYETETRCIHFDRALDLTLEDGVLAKIRVESPDHVPQGLTEKELGKNYGRTYGSFRGLLEPKIVFGLHKHIVEEEYGKPKKEQKIELQDTTGVVARAEYDHLVLEYERIENGNTILTAFELTPDEKSLGLMKKAREDLKAKAQK